MTWHAWIRVDPAILSGLGRCAVRTYVLGFAAGFLALDVGVRFGGGAEVGVFATGKGLGARRRIEPNKSPQIGSSSPSGGNGEGGKGGFLFMACVLVWM
jgi:hypothetical protein